MLRQCRMPNTAGVVIGVTSAVVIVVAVILLSVLLTQTSSSSVTSSGIFANYVNTPLLIVSENSPQLAQSALCNNNGDASVLFNDTQFAPTFGNPYVLWTLTPVQMYSNTNGLFTVSCVPGIGSSAALQYLGATSTKLLSTTYVNVTLTYQKSAGIWKLGPVITIENEEGQQLAYLSGTVKWVSASSPTLSNTW